MGIGAAPSGYDPRLVVFNVYDEYNILRNRATEYKEQMERRVRTAESQIEHVAQIALVEGILYRRSGERKL